MAELIESETIDPSPLNPAYPLSQLSKETHISAEQLSMWLSGLERKKQAILYGPPGTGKTYTAKRLARHLIGGGDGFVETVQFHPAYSYEEFVQGIRPKAVDGVLQYPLVDGRFLEFCKGAEKRKGRCVLIIDEINRANLSRVLGELMYLLEYRDETIPLAGGKRFGIPSNVRVIGTMNTADKSISLVDHALRRRFAFLALYPDYPLLLQYQNERGFDASGLVSVLSQVNQQIGDKHFEIGISYFLHDDLGTKIEEIWRMEIEPYLDEYFYDHSEEAEAFSWESVAEKILP